MVSRERIERQPATATSASLRVNRGPLPHIRIEPSKGWVSLKLRELWEYRELLYFLVWRDVKVRYKQTVLGAAWAIIQPFFSMVVFSVFLGDWPKSPRTASPTPSGAMLGWCRGLSSPTG